jgi:hypothetical protein
MACASGLTRQVAGAQVATKILQKEKKKVATQMMQEKSCATILTSN